MGAPQDQKGGELTQASQMAQSAGGSAGGLNNLAWIAVDWGTSNLRVWAMDDSADILAETQSPLGMNAIAGDEKLSFEGVLTGLIGRWLSPESRSVPVVICGMAGARQGSRALLRRARCPC